MNFGYETGAQGIIPGRPNIIFLHGAGGCAEGWRGLLSAIGKNWNTIAIDLPGHGKTPDSGFDRIESFAAWLKDVIPEFGSEKIILAGHSMGGAIAQRFAIDNPDILAGLILVGTGASLPVNPKILDGIKNDFEKTAAMIIDWCFAESDQTTKKISLEMMIEAGSNVLFNDFTACSRFDVTGELNKIKIPSLILTGSKDKMTPIKFSQFLSDNIADARLAVVENAGHMVQVEKVRDTIKLISEFAEEIF